MDDLSKRAIDNRANQLNPKHAAYYQSRGLALDDAKRMAAQSKRSPDNRANQPTANNLAPTRPRREAKALLNPSVTRSERKLK